LHLFQTYPNLFIVARIISVANRKGGVGKTTTSINLAASLAAAEKKVLVIDLDPQGNATSAIGGQADPQENIYQVLVHHLQEEEYIITPQATAIDNLHLLAGSADIAGLQLELIEHDSSQYILRDLLARRSLKINDTLFTAQDLDYVIVDTPPGLDLLTINALTAAERLIVPVQAEYLALEGLSQMIETFTRVREAFNPGLTLMQVLITMYDVRLCLARAVGEDIRTKLDEQSAIQVMKTVIPRSVKLAEAPSFGLPVMLFDPASSGALAYIELAKEVMSDEETGSRPGSGDPAAEVQSIAV